MEEILDQLIGSLSHYLQGFIRPRWCRISSINSMFKTRRWINVHTFPNCLRSIVAPPRIVKLQAFSSETPRRFVPRDINGIDRQIVCVSPNAMKPAKHVNTQLVVSVDLIHCHSLIESSITYTDKHPCNSLDTRKTRKSAAENLVLAKSFLLLLKIRFCRVTTAIQASIIQA